MLLAALSHPTPTPRGLYAYLPPGLAGLHLQIEIAKTPFLQIFTSLRRLALPNPWAGSELILSFIGLGMQHEANDARLSPKFVKLSKTSSLRPPEERHFSSFLPSRSSFPRSSTVTKRSSGDGHEDWFRQGRTDQLSDLNETSVTGEITPHESQGREEHQHDNVPSVDTSCARCLVKKVFGIGPADENYPASHLIYPYSPFAIFWLSSTCFALLYTAIVTPAIIAFHWLDDECDVVPSLNIDIAMDTFFLCDILVSFFLGIVYQGQYMDDWRWVAKKYLTGSFLFDLLTSIPVSFIEFSIARACAATTHQEHFITNISPTQLRLIRAAKPLRWFKLAR